MDQSIIERVFATVFPLVAIATIGYGYGRWRKPDLKLINQITAVAFAATCMPDFMVVCALAKNRQAVFKKVE